MEELKLLFEKLKAKYAGRIFIEVYTQDIIVNYFATEFLNNSSNRIINRINIPYTRWEMINLIISQQVAELLFSQGYKFKIIGENNFTIYEYPKNDLENEKHN